MTIRTTLSALSLSLLLAATAVPATFDVDSTADVGDDSTGDGLCLTSAGECTIRAAVQQANFLGGSHQVNVPAGTYTLSGNSSLSISSDMTMVGAGLQTTVIDGNMGLQIFYVASGHTVSVSGLTLQDTSDQNSSGGCISNAGHLTLTDVLVDNCSSVDQNAGGVRNDGTLVMNSVTVSGCSAPLGGGGGVMNFGTATLTDVVVSGNSAYSIGGGIYNHTSGADLTLTDVTVSGNWLTSPTSRAGGIFSSAALDATGLTVESNQASSGAGLECTDDCDMTLTNATFSGNTATGAGGAMAIGYGGDATLTNVTIADNSDDGTSGAIHWTGGAADLELANILIADNGAVNCGSTYGFTSLGHNLEDQDSCGLDAIGDQVNATPLLGPLADNGGPTRTIALLGGSPGIDDGDDALAPAQDQRGVARPQDGDDSGSAVSDIGAFELQSAIFADGFESGTTSSWS